MEKRIEDLEESVRTLAQFIKNEVRRLEATKKMEEKMPKGLTAEDRVREMERVIDDQTKTINEIRNILKGDVDLDIKSRSLEEMRSEEEDVERLAIEKKVLDLRHKISSLEANVKKPAEIKTIVDRSYIVKEMEEFARKMDEKYPNLATRDEFETFKKEINNKIDLIETPNLEHIEKKIEDLEKTLSDITEVMRKLSRKIPAVVE